MPLLPWFTHGGLYRFFFFLCGSEAIPDLFTKECVYLFLKPPYQIVIDSNSTYDRSIIVLGTR